MHDITESDIGILPREGETVTLGFSSKDCFLVK